jgi:D-beta-D-heptose 7-phosphate kinase/D-beta-D-heptose 1-phosphate adenosyltransferase
LSNVKNEKLKSLLGQFSKKNVMVVGDVMADEYIWGKVTRISPEAPIPVIQVTGETQRPGGASNVANNLRALGAQVHLVGVIGADSVGKRLTQILAERGIGAEGLIVDRDRPTIQKTRVIAQHQQVVRIDRERLAEMPVEIYERVRQYCARVMDQCDAVLLSDYAKGLLSPKLVELILGMARAKKKIVTADPKPNNILSFKGVTLISPNVHEAEAASGVHISSPETLKEAGHKLLAMLDCEAVLVTRGEEGMSLFDRKGQDIHVPAKAKEVFDVSGAGDTVISTLTLGLACGGSFEESIILANHAAGIVVGEVGVATCTTAEIERDLE